MAKLSAGDVFEMTAGDGMSGYGQIITARNTLYVVIFEKLHSFRPDINEVIEDHILLVGWTMDALIHHKRWQVIGRLPVVRNVPFPRYQVLQEGRIRVTDYLGTPMRLATPSEADLLDHMSSYSPITFQNSFFAHHGLNDYSPPTEILYDHVRARSLSLAG